MIGWISVNSSEWQPFSKAPKDGRIIVVCDSEGTCDLVRWDRNEWTAECGTMNDDWRKFAELHLCRRNSSCTDGDSE